MLRKYNSTGQRTFKAFRLIVAKMELPELIP
jgi:hypothetical protein